MTLRKTPLKRSPMKRKPRRRKVSEEGAAYMAWVREQACVFDYLGDCDGGTEAHHHGPKGLGQKTSDFQCAPLCAGHHHRWHRVWGGAFKMEARAHINMHGWRLLVEWLESRPTEETR